MGESTPLALRRQMDACSQTEFACEMALLVDGIGRLRDPSRWLAALDSRETIVRLFGLAPTQAPPLKFR